MRKLLYITFENYQTFSGGTQCSRRNQQALEELLGKENVIKYILKPNKQERGIADNIKRGFDIFKGFFGGLTSEGLNNILQVLRKEKCTDLFIDSSQLGCVAKYAKRYIPNLRIYTFFHNIEYDFCKSNVIHCKDYPHFFWILLAKNNEKTACQYSDCIITLNTKDSTRLKALYGRNSDINIPITMKDDYQDSPVCNTLTGSQKEALFVGSYFFGNTHGLSWFCNDVLPHINAHLTIVGSNMEKFTKHTKNKDNISIYNNVPDLKEYYEMADFVVLPITTGGGMKVKTAEALKYGKYIIGTQEALEGYDYNADIATVCNNANEFIKAINEYNPSNKFNPASRNLFIQNYSYEASLKLFKKTIIQA